MKTAEKIINLIKVNGPLTAKFLAEELDLTTMGVRQHLQLLEESGDLETEDRAQGRGRPSRYWKLTPDSDVHFEDRHDELTVQLIDSVRQVFGDSGLDKLIKERERVNFESYHAEISKAKKLQTKVVTLSALRTREGYMASWQQILDDFWLFENHCPICAAATQCQNFCLSELELFQCLFEGVAIVTRDEHIIEGARRCAYKFSPIS